jgi:hypothetical protein
MPTKDEWGHDPSVCSMRRVFKNMEAVQNRLLGNLTPSSFDPRLREWREAARDLFEQVWTMAVRRGLVSDEEGAGILYAHCLAQTLRLSGIEIPLEGLPQDERIYRLVQEVST